MPHQIDIEAARRAAQATRRREQAEREGLLVPDAPPGHRADGLRYVSPPSIACRQSSELLDFATRLIHMRPSSNSFRRALQREVDGIRVDYRDYERSVLRSWRAIQDGVQWTLNPIPPDLALLVCAALDEALVYVEPIDDDEPWDDDDYVETAEPVRSPRLVNRAMVTGGGDTIQFADSHFEWNDEDD